MKRNARSPWNNRMLYSDKPKPQPVRGDLVCKPDAVLARIKALYSERKKPVPAELVLIDCNAWMTKQQRMLGDVLAELQATGRVRLADDGMIPGE
jgi:hypothetical protein